MTALLSIARNPLAQGIAAALVLAALALGAWSGYQVGHATGDRVGYARADAEWTARQAAANAVADERIRAAQADAAARIAALETALADAARAPTEAARVRDLPSARLPIPSDLADYLEDLRRRRP